MDEAVYQSEKATGHKNRALAFLLKANGLLEDDVEDVVDMHFRACSISVDCRDLAPDRLRPVQPGKGPGQRRAAVPPQLRQLCERRADDLRDAV